MNRLEAESYIAMTYGTAAEHPWVRYPAHVVFRHDNNRKWFALIMRVPKEKLGLPDTGFLDILNVKCEALMIGSLRVEPGIFPAYHMSKESWVSLALDGSVADETIKMLLDMSFDLTGSKIQKRSRGTKH